MAYAEVLPLRRLSVGEGTPLVRREGPWAEAVIGPTPEVGA